MKKLLVFAAAAALLASLTACGNTANAADGDYIYGQIDSVSGNDVVLMLADYNENADSGDADPAEDSGSEKSAGDSKRERPEGFDPSNMPEGFDKSNFSGEKPEGFDPSNMPEGFDKSNFSGEKPEGFSRSKRSDDETDTESGESRSERKKPENFDFSNMPEGFEKPENGEMPEGFEKPADGEMPEGFDRSKFGGRSKSGSSSRYTLTGEQEELRIAVGTTVTTALGVETDFDVLKAGDLVKCTVEKDSDGNDVITAVWIMEG